MSTEIPTIILKRLSQLQGDGKSFLRSTPLHCYVRVGKMDTPVKALTDPCSNVGLMDMVMFCQAFPRLEIRPLAASVSGVGTNKTSGFAVVPIHFDCTRNNAHEIVQADMEAHLVENFSPWLVLGLDFLCDYGMELNIAKKIASFPTGHTTRLASPPSSHLSDVKVLAVDRTTIPGRTIQPIAIQTPRIAENIDYTFLPFTTAEKGMAPSPQLMHAVIDYGTKSMMFSNWSEHPIVIERDQQLGTAQPVLFGCRFHQTGSHINWNNMTKPGAATCGSEGVIAIPGEQECYHVELTASHSTSVSRPPRSIPEGETALISAKARSRTKGELFPPEDDGDALLETCPFTEGKPMVSPHLSESQ